MNWLLDGAADEAWSGLHAARELDGGGWAYTCRSGGAVQALGGCTARCRHATREEAEQHYLQHVLDAALLHGRWRGKEYRCEVCGCWTDRYAVLETHLALPLCAAHLNRGGLASVARRPQNR